MRLSNYIYHLCYVVLHLTYTRQSMRVGASLRSPKRPLSIMICVIDPPQVVITALRYTHLQSPIAHSLVTTSSYSRTATIARTIFFVMPGSGRFTGGECYATSQTGTLAEQPTTLSSEAHTAIESDPDNFFREAFDLDAASESIGDFLQHTDPVSPDPAKDALSRRESSMEHCHSEYSELIADSYITPFHSTGSKHRRYSEVTSSCLGTILRKI